MKITKFNLSIILAFLLLGNIAVFPQTTDTPYVSRQKDALKGIKDFKLAVSYVMPGTERFIKKEPLETSVRKYLIQSGLNILTKPYAPMLQNAPTIQIVLSFQTYNEDQNMIFSASVEVSESAFLVRDKESQLLVITWQKSFFGSSTIKDVSKISVLLKDYLDLLIDDWKSINIKKP